MSNNLLPTVTTIVDLGAGNLVTLSTMGDTTHVKTDQGACFHVRQLSMDSIYFEPAQRIIRQSRLLSQLERDVRQMTVIHKGNVNDHNSQTTPAGRAETFDYMCESQRRLNFLKKELDGLRLAMTVQNCADNYLNQ